MKASVARDPLYRDIVEGLSQHLGPALFERVAIDLLRPTYPGLASITGGADRGMDGAIWVPGGGPAVPLVCTTSEEVPRNLAKNLESYLRNGGASREVVLVTSQSLTTRIRQNLEKKAKDLGFELRNIHEREDLAGRLYDDPDRRRELLGLTGRLPALSVYPLSRPPGGGEQRFGRRQALGQRRLLHNDRPLAEDQLLGREEDLAWLRAQEDDFVLVGQPGVGKKSLLRVLALEGRGLFVASNKMHRVADDYRAALPKLLFVDDAHLRGDLLENVLRMRQVLRAPFMVAATAWPSHRERFGHWATREIEPVSPAVAARIVRSVNKRWRDELVMEIAIQSRGRPRLAVALAEHVAERRDVPDSGSSHLHDLVKGRLLLRQMVQRASLSGRELHMLAHFALGGQQGATLANVAQAMELPETDVSEMLRKTAVTGVIKAVGTTVAVVGQALRSALLGRSFFDGAFRLSVDRAIDATADSSSTTCALICAIGRGHAVPHELVRRRILGDPTYMADTELWQQYARTGSDAVQWIIDRHPAKLLRVADSALRFAPKRSLPLLIKSMSFSAIEAWITEPSPETLARREQLLDVLTAAYDDGSCSYGLSLVSVVFSLRLQSSPSVKLDDRDVPAQESAAARWDAASAVGEDTQISWCIRGLSTRDVRRLHALWKNRALDFLRTAGDGITAARKVATSWAAAPDPRQLGSLLDSESKLAVRECSAAMIADVVALAGSGAGIVLWARHLADCFEVPVVDVPPADPELEQLFSLGFDADALRRRRAAVRRAADKLSQREPATGVEKLLGWQAEAELTGYSSPSGALEEVARRIAETAPNPGAWFAVLASRQAAAEWASPFLDAVLASGQECTEAWETLLANGQYAHLLVQAAIHHHDDLPQDVVERVVEQLPDVGVAWEFVDWESISDAWQDRILTHRDRQAAVAAASSILRYRRERSVALSGMPEPVLTAWRRAVLESADEHLLHQAFVADPEVAREWFLAAPRAPQPPDRELYETAASVLDEDDRRKLIEVLEPDTYPEALRALAGQIPASPAT